MAVTTKWYGQAKVNMAKGDIDWDTDTIKVMLTTSSYTPDQDAHDYKADVTNEVTATGYTAGGGEITNTTLTYTSGTNTLSYDGDNVAWTITGTLTFRYGVIYDDTATDDPLIAYIDFGEDQTIVDGTLTFNFSSDGILEDVIA